MNTFFIEISLNLIQTLYVVDVSVTERMDTGQFEDADAEKK